MSNPQPQNRLLCGVELVEDSIVVLLFAAIVVIALLQIILRNLFDGGFSWATPALGILLLWLTLSGAVVAARKGNHIAINVLSHNLSPYQECLVRTVTNVFTAFICAVIAYYSVLFVQMDYEMESTLFADVPAWVGELILPISFSLLAVRYGIAAVDQAHKLKRR